MRLVRSTQLDPLLPQTVHVSSKCARSLFLLVPAARADGSEEAPEEHVDLRKELMMERLEELQKETSIVICGFSLMDNHVHLILKNEAAAALAWPAKEVVRRWLALHPPRDWRSKLIEVSDEKVTEMAMDKALVAKRRRQLADVSTFMKDFKQRVAQQVNVLEGIGGRFWDGTFKSTLIHDEQQLVATMIYVDLNPFAAGTCPTPEEGRYTSLAGRLHKDVPVLHRESDAADPADRKQHGPDGPRSLQMPRRRGCAAWLRPKDESAERARRRVQTPLKDAEALRAASAGTVAAGLSLRVYLRLVDAVARMLRPGKRRLHARTRSIFERMGLDADAVGGAVLALAARHAAPG